jgi:hypothetical protein
MVEPVAREVGANPAEHLLRVALTHPECVGGAVLEPEGGRARIRLDMNVEMPIDMKADGISSSGIRTQEPVVLILPPDYPWRSPRFYFREDFPINFPHLMPFAAAPRPCLVEGDQDEYFLQFGLVEYGVFHLIEQLAIWLRKAATSDLINPEQGWEPMLRRHFRDVIVIDADAARKAVTKNGGWVIWHGEFFRKGSPEGRLNEATETWISSKGGRTPLMHKSADKTFLSRLVDSSASIGNTVVGVVWPDKNPDGTPNISQTYLPESVATLGDLRVRADLLGCKRGLDTVLANIERSFASMTLLAPIPIGIVLCVRRPIQLIDSSSDIELLPYVVEVRATQNRTSLFAQGDDEPVAPALHYQPVTSKLLSSLSGALTTSRLSVLGCGSVGSKLTMHAARSGQDIVAVSDNSWLRPHNMARHALGAQHISINKAEALARELAGFCIEPVVHKGDLSRDLRVPGRIKQILPKTATAAINSTASLSVREALVYAATPSVRVRLFEAALFGRGRGAFLLADGARHNPNHCDLIAELYATLEDRRITELLFDPAGGLTEIQVGQGCGSLTMTISDARLSAMTASLSMEISSALDRENKDGLIVIGTAEENSPSTCWTRCIVPAFEAVAIAGSDGWQLRISRRVADRIRAEARAHSFVETGGVMIGLTSARLKTVTVVDLLEAPADSHRTASQFTLGTLGLESAIRNRHEQSGQTLFDVGTWHTHLGDEGPSSTDWKTATDLAAERAPPSILLISTPARFYAIVSSRKDADD